MYDETTRGRRAAIGIATLLGAGIATYLVVQLALGEREAPARCPSGLVALGPRCCAPGQRLEAGSCVGAPDACPSEMRATADGCIANPRRVKIPGGRLRIGPSDWEAEGVIEARETDVARFELDATEVTHARWKSCARAGACRALASREPGLPVTGVSAEDAEAFCKFEKGRLPSGDEWLLAASGTEHRRFPWGSTGLVCRRAAFGLADGPCGAGADGPELAGARPDGASPRGVLDLAGNVAEWAREPDGSHRARGGSYRSRVAADLKSWAAEPMPAERSAPHIGFRCAYGLQSR